MHIRNLLLTGALLCAGALFGADAAPAETTAAPERSAAVQPAEAPAPAAPAETAEKPAAPEQTVTTQTTETPDKTVTTKKTVTAEKTVAPEQTVTTQTTDEQGRTVTTKKTVTTETVVTTEKTEVKERKKQVVKPRIAVFSFTTIDIQGQHLRDFTDRTVPVTPQNSLNEAELGAIDEVMLGYIKQIDAEEERTRRAHDRKRLDDENDRNLARQYELADKLLKTPERAVVIGANYMEAALGKYDSVIPVDRGEIYQAFRDMAARQAGGTPRTLPETLQLHGATHVLYGTVADLRVSRRAFSGYGVNTEVQVYELDVLIKIADIKTNAIVFSGVFTGTDQEFKLEGLQIVDSGRFDRLMKSATEQAAQAIDKKFDPQETK